MKHKATVAALLLSSVAAPLALAAPPPGKGKPPATGPGCKPRVAVILRGALTSDPGAGATSFTMSVKGANRHGRSLIGASVTIAVDAKTKIRRTGAKSVEALASGDRANVQLLRCKADLPLSPDTADDVPAARVTAQPSS